MIINKVNLNAEEMSIEDISVMINELKRIRNRKGDARDRYNNFLAMIHEMKDAEMVFCNRYTGEIMNPNDWQIYDNQIFATYPEGK